MNRVGVILLMLFMLSGCTSPVAEDVEIIQSDNDEELQGVNVVAKTLGREIDVTADYNLLEQSGNNSTLILWAAAGCNGCHLWTEMIRQCMLNGTISEESNVITIHRYPRFETFQYVYDTYGNNSSKHYSPWPVLVPSEADTAWDASTGEQSSVSLSEAFNNPVTPTLQVIDSRGLIIWQSKTYYPDYSILQDAMGALR